MRLAGDFVTRHGHGLVYFHLGRFSFCTLQDRLAGALILGALGRAGVLKRPRRAAL
jgi:hypothetical protein